MTNSNTTTNNGELSIMRHKRRVLGLFIMISTFILYVYSEYYFFQQLQCATDTQYEALIAFHPMICLGNAMFIIIFAAMTSDFIVGSEGENYKHLPHFIIRVHIFNFICKSERGFSDEKHIRYRNNIDAALSNLFLQWFIWAIWNLLFALPGCEHIIDNIEFDILFKICMIPAIYLTYYIIIFIIISIKFIYHMFNYAMCYRPDDIQNDTKNDIENSTSYIFEESSESSTYKESSKSSTYEESSESSTYEEYITPGNIV